MGLPKYRTHIGQMNMAQCEQVIRIVYAAGCETKKEAA